MGEGWKAINFHQLDCKKPKIRPLNPFTLGAKVQKVVALQNVYMALLFDQGNGLST